VALQGIDGARRLALCLLLLLLPALGWTQAASGQLGSGAALQARFAALKPQLDKNPFGRPLTLESTEGDGQLSGNIFAVVAHPFDQVSAALSRPAVWCEVLMLHLNTKSCAVHTAAAGTTLALAVGRKFDQPGSETQSLVFTWQPGVASADYLDMRLSADKGPFGTHDYRIEIEATPVAGGKTFIHMSYAYAYGTAARLAISGYLATLGSDKVGFSPSGDKGAGPDDLVGGVRGVVERNTMRYYLAIDAYLDYPADAQLPQRLGAWFDSTERYARQLHEIPRADYLAMKQNQYKGMTKH
jgi:hypothetical protein